MVWDIIKATVHEIEMVNDIEFADSAWQRFKEMERKIIEWYAAVEYKQAPAEDSAFLPTGDHGAEHVKMGDCEYFISPMQTASGWLVQELPSRRVRYGIATKEKARRLVRQWIAQRDDGGG